VAFSEAEGEGGVDISLTLTTEQANTGERDNTKSRLFYSHVIKTWQLEQVVSTIDSQLPRRRARLCNNACMLLQCACGYAIHHGVLTYNGRQVSQFSTVVGEVAPGVHLTVGQRQPSARTNGSWAPMTTTGLPLWGWSRFGLTGSTIWKQH